jgi:copper resistance protein B
MRKLIALSLLALSPMLPIFAIAYGEEIKPMHPTRFGGFFVDKLEYRTKNEDLKFHIYSFYGGDYHKLLVDVEGERGLKDSEWLIERADLLFVKAISSSLDLRAGVGYAGSNEGGRSKLVLGVNGHAPYGFDVDANLNLTNKAELYGKLGVEYELLLTQRFILQPSFEVLASTKKIEPLGIGSGLSKTELALRLRYEIKGEFAPYVGISWERHFGQTKEMVGKRDLINFLVGLKTWF